MNQRRHQPKHHNRRPDNLVSQCLSGPRRLALWQPEDQEERDNRSHFTDTAPPQPEGRRQT